jgi:putative ABC transport system ATP-binding protein
VEVRSLYRAPEPHLEPAAVEWPALELHDVFKIFHSGPVETVALRGVSLKLHVGELTAILGPSGCGKSTLLSLAAALDEPSAGEVRAHGASLARLDEEQLADYRAREIAVVFQSDNLWPTLTARENVELALRLAGSGDIRDRAQSALESFGLARRADNHPSELSGGEQQRVAIAGAAARDAKLLLADEPTGELDRDNERIVLEALERLRSEHGATVLLVTHSSAVADAADRVIQMRDGRRVA